MEMNDLLTSHLDWKVEIISDISIILCYDFGYIFFHGALVERVSLFEIAYQREGVDWAEKLLSCFAF